MIFIFHQEDMLSAGRRMHCNSCIIFMTPEQKIASTSYQKYKIFYKMV